MSKANFKVSAGYFVVLYTVVSLVMVRWFPSVRQFQIELFGGIYIVGFLSLLGFLLSFIVSVALLLYLRHYHTNIGTRTKGRFFIISIVAVGLIALVASSEASTITAYGFPLPFLWMSHNRLSGIRMDLLPFIINTFFVYVIIIFFSKLLQAALHLSERNLK